jgi:hypothetical protein
MYLVNKLQGYCVGCRETFLDDRVFVEKLCIRLKGGHDVIQILHSRAADLNVFLDTLESC